MGDVLAVDEDAPALRVVLPAQQLDQRRLAGAGRSDEPDLFAGLDVETEILEHRLAVGMGEADMLEADAALRDGERLRIRRIDDLVLRRDEFERFGQRAQLFEIVEHAEGQFLHGIGDLAAEEEHHGEGADRQPAVQRVDARQHHQRHPQRQRGELHEARIMMRNRRSRRDAFISSSRKKERKRRS